MITLSTNIIFFSFFVFSCVGYTLLTYSKDGDIKNREVISTNIKKLNLEDAWSKLILLSNFENSEVNWNTSLFVAFVSSVVFLGCVSYARELETLDSKTTAMLWFISVFTVFGLQDIIFRWKMAHRKQALIAEKMALIEKIRSFEKTGFMY